MKVLVVYAHPNPESFNHAVVEKFTKGLLQGGHEYELIDLYAEGFDPITRLEDFGQFSGEPMPQDVLEEQKRVSDADALVLIGPVLGWSIPAIMKGWIDRVFSHGFSYQIAENGEIIGLLKHKKGLIIVTTGFPEQVFKRSGVEDTLRKIYLELTLKLMGVENTDLVMLYGVQAVGEQVRKQYLKSVRQLGVKF
jgi:NAD(P)H dehydrogenase (quinone)